MDIPTAVIAADTSDQHGQHPGQSAEQEHEAEQNPDDRVHWSTSFFVLGMTLAA